jgi:hypothetical protein
MPPASLAAPSTCTSDHRATADRRHRRDISQRGRRPIDAATGDDVAWSGDGKPSAASPVKRPCRSLIRLTSAPPCEPGTARHGYRRIEWIEKAVAPLRDEITESDFERLVSALAMVVGWEALVVLEDLRGLDGDEQQAVSLWAARALISATLRRENDGDEPAGNGTVGAQ